MFVGVSLILNKKNKDEFAELDKCVLAHHRNRTNRFQRNAGTLRTAQCAHLCKFGASYSLFVSKLRDSASNVGRKWTQKSILPSTKCLVSGLLNQLGDDLNYFHRFKLLTWLRVEQNGLESKSLSALSERDGERERGRECFIRIVDTSKENLVHYEEILYFNCPILMN